MPDTPPTPDSQPKSQLRRTPLHDLHVELGAKMVPFAGWSMPVQFPAGLTAEHHHTRSGASLFDVSHMGQLSVRAETVGAAATALEAAISADIAGLGHHRQRYGLLTNERGGIIDDLMITKRADDLSVIVNASNAEEDIAHLRNVLGAAAQVGHLAHRALLAIQGPQAVQAVCSLDPSAGDLRFMQGAPLVLIGAACFATRSGYTGEDGFEISVPADAADAIARALLAHPAVNPAGLGARDSLRLEAGMCLHGHDIDATVNPVDAALTWAIPKVRRAGGARHGGYPGSSAIDELLATGPTRKRVGLIGKDRTPVREGATLHADDGSVVGIVTSGTVTPTAGAPIAMGYVPTALSSESTPINADVRGRSIPMTVTQLPFVPHSYVR
jgi:aminomethyltransferase